MCGGGPCVVYGVGRSGMCGGGPCVMCGVGRSGMRGVGRSGGLFGGTYCRQA